LEFTQMIPLYSNMNGVVSFARMLKYFA